MTQVLTPTERTLLCEYMGLRNRVNTTYVMAGKIINLDTPILNGISVDSSEWVNKLPELITLYQSELSKIVTAMGKHIDKDFEIPSIDGVGKSELLTILYDEFKKTK